MPSNRITLELFYDYSGFFKVAALCAFYFAAIQLVQSWLSPRIPNASSFADPVMREIHPYSVLRYRLVLSSMFFLLLSFIGVEWAIYPTNPYLGRLGYLFSLIFVLIEILYRSVELFGVNARLIPQYLAETDTARKASLHTLIEAFNLGVIALYFPLLMAHLLASVFFGLGLIGLGGLSTLVSVALFANAARLLIRILSMHMGVKTLASASQRIYYPVVISTYTLIGVWLWTL